MQRRQSGSKSDYKHDLDLTENSILRKRKILKKTNKIYFFKYFLKFMWFSLLILSIILNLNNYNQSMVIIVDTFVLVFGLAGEIIKVEDYEKVEKEINELEAYQESLKNRLGLNNLEDIEAVYIDND